MANVQNPCLTGTDYSLNKREYDGGESLLLK